MFKYRLISFPLLLALAFAVVFWQPYGGYIFMVLVLPVALAAVLESCNIVRKLQLPVHRYLALLAAVLLLAKYGYGTVFPAEMRCLPELSGIMVFVFTVLMLKTLFCRENNKTSAVICAFVTPGVDTGGYIAGMLSNKLMKNGNHKIVPSISPKKSWEGTVGAAIFSIVTALLLVRFECITMNVAETVIFGFCAFLGSFAGDLTESQLKRAAGIKDSANWIPGMGGILDVLDSFIYNAPIFYLALKSGVLVCQ